MSWKKEDLGIIIQQQRQINRLDKLLEQKNGGGKKDSGGPDPNAGMGCAICIIGFLILAVIGMILQFCQAHPIISALIGIPLLFIIVLSAIAYLADKKGCLADKEGKKNGIRKEQKKLYDSAANEYLSSRSDLATTPNNAAIKKTNGSEQQSIGNEESQSLNPVFAKDSRPAPLIKPVPSAKKTIKSITQNYTVAYQSGSFELKCNTACELLIEDNCLVVNSLVPTSLTSRREVFRLPYSSVINVAVMVGERKQLFGCKSTTKLLSMELYDKDGKKLSALFARGGITSIDKLKDKILEAKNNYLQRHGNPEEIEHKNLDKTIPAIQGSSSTTEVAFRCNMFISMASKTMTVTPALKEKIFLYFTLLTAKNDPKFSDAQFFGNTYESVLHAQAARIVSMGKDVPKNELTKLDAIDLQTENENEINELKAKKLVYLAVCPHCGNEFKWEPELDQQEAVCTNCNKDFIVDFAYRGN